MNARWPVYLLIGVTAFALAVLLWLPPPPSREVRALPAPPAAPPESAASLWPEPAFAPVAAAPAPATDALFASTDESVGERVLASLPSSTDHPNMSPQELFAILATQYVYVGFTEFNDSRRGTLMRRSNRERIAVQERTEIDGMTVRSLDRERCVLAQGPNTYTLYLVDMDYIERVRNQLPLPVPSEEDRAKRQRYYEEMFNRPERARNARVGEVNYPTRPLSPEEEEEGKRAYVDATLGPKLDRMRQERESGKNLHPGAALSPDERGSWDPLSGPPQHPSQMRPLTPEEYREAFRRYWERNWPGRTPLPGADEPPPPPADLSDIVVERRGGSR